MGRFVRSRRHTLAITAAAAMWAVIVLAAGASPAPQQPAAREGVIVPAASSHPPVVSPPAAGRTRPLPADNAGEAKCVECHEDQAKAYHDTAHARSRNPRTPASAQSCETCHGPGREHVATDGEAPIDNPVKMAPRQVSDVCTSCHTRSEHNQWAGGKHDGRNISCATCHSIHEPKSESAQLKKASQTATCVQCHKTQVSKVRRSAHMPVREGKMECTTCHNPHGSQNVKMLREGSSVNESCASCHAEKRGPFLWEHAPGRENCVTCHDPHGSNNERMLVAKAPMLCQRCHAHSRHPATIYDNVQLTVNRSNRVVGRACLNCHSQIHGSNHPASGKVFIR
jgi:DmsE family decaheme c-type cytochrome